MYRKNASARYGLLRHSSNVRNGLRIIAMLLCSFVFATAAIAAYAVWDLSRKITTVELPDDTALSVGSSDTISGAFNVFLAGSDSRRNSSLDDGETGELNDVNMMLHISADHKRATVVSFPRDLMLPIPSCPGPNGEPKYYSAKSEQQLNATLQYGLPCVVATIEQLTGADINYAGLITFDGVINMSNAIGGVDVCLTKPIKDPKTDLNLPAGDVTLVGREALQFLRTRYGVGHGGDTSRISNQQVFLSALMRKIQTESILLDPIKVYGLAKAAVANMTLSQNMASVGFMQAVASIVRGIPLDNITFVQYPTFAHPYQTSRLTPDKASAKVLMTKVLNDQPLTVAKTGEGVVEGERTGANNSQNASQGTSARQGSEAGSSSTGSSSSRTEDTESEDSATAEDEELPQNVTGQKASDVTCSAGRTRY